MLIYFSQYPIQIPLTQKCEQSLGVFPIDNFPKVNNRWLKNLKAFCYQQALLLVLEYLKMVNTDDYFWNEDAKINIKIKKIWMNKEHHFGTQMHLDAFFTLTFFYGWSTCSLIDKWWARQHFSAIWHFGWPLWGKVISDFNVRRKVWYSQLCVLQFILLQHKNRILVLKNLGDSNTIWVAWISLTLSCLVIHDLEIKFDNMSKAIKLIRESD